MNKMNSFVKQFVAVVTGDDAEALGMKVWRKAESGLKVQIAAMEGDTIKLEDDVTNAEEGLSLARVNNGKDITDRERYVDQLTSAENTRRIAVRALKEHNEQLDFIKEQYSALKKEVKE